MTARQVVLQEDEVAFPHAFVSRERFSDTGEVADILVSHHERAGAQRQAVLGHVGATDARDFDLHQRRVIGDGREIELAELRGRRADLQRGQNFFRQSDISRNDALPAVRSHQLPVRLQTADC